MVSRDELVAARTRTRVTVAGPLRDERGRTPVEWATNGEVATALQA